VKDHRLYAGIWLLAATGMRLGELLGLRWTDVDLDASALSVRQSLIAVHHVTRIETPKNGKARALRLDPTTVAILRAHKARQSAERLAWGSAWTDSGLVFTREDGVLLHPDTFSKMFRKLSEAAGVRPIRLHDVRHGYATLALKAGTHPKVVQQRLGHSSIMVTLDIYSHVPDELDDQAATVLSRAMEG
jgi:integrase